MENSKRKLGKIFHSIILHIGKVFVQHLNKQSDRAIKKERQRKQEKQHKKTKKDRERQRKKKITWGMKKKALLLSNCIKFTKHVLGKYLKKKEKTVIDKIQNFAFYLIQKPTYNNSVSSNHTNQSSVKTSDG